MDDAIRTESMLVWASAFLVFLPGALRAFRHHAALFDFFWMAAAFACANRVMFGITALFAPEWIVLSQLWGLAAAVWLAIVAYKVAPRGWR